MRPAVASRTDTLAARVRAGDAAAETEFVAVFYGDVLSKIMARGVDCHAALDLTQVVMIAVLVGLREGRIRHPERIAHYVHGTLCHLVSAHFRKCGRTASSGLPSLEAVDVSADELLVIQEDLGVLNEALDHLAPTDRTILRLSAVEGLSSDEVALVVGMNAGQVRQRKCRAIRRLRHRLRQTLT